MPGLCDFFSEEDRSHQVPLHDDQLLQQVKVRMDHNMFVLHMRQTIILLP